MREKKENQKKYVPDGDYAQQLIEG